MLLPAETSTLSSMTATYQQSYAGFDGLSLLSETELKSYEASIRTQTINSTSMTAAQVNVLSQEANPLADKCIFQVRALAKILTMIHDLAGECNKLNKIAAFLCNHVSNTAQQKIN